MFTGAQLTKISYRPPWQLTFEERISALISRNRRIAYFYEKPDTSTFRYRVFNMVQAINVAPELDVSASWFTLDDLCYTESFIDRADALIICRTRYSDGINRMVTRARARGVRIFFDSDDLVFDPAYIHLILDTLALPQDSEAIWNDWFAYVGRMSATLRICDGAIVTNRYLAGRVQQVKPGIETQIVPNFLNRMQQKTSDEIWQAKTDSGFARDSQIHIGYFSGTPTHNRDFQVVAPALANVLKENPNVVLRVVGFLEAKEPMLQFKDRIEIFPLQDFLHLQKLIGEVEINVAPLQDNVFTNCKSELKYFEAAAVGTVTVGSPTYTLSSVIRDGENGFLANGHAWETALTLAVETAANRTRYAEMAERAYLHTRENYSWDSFGATIASAVFGSASHREERSGQAVEKALSAVGAA